MFFRDLTAYHYDVPRAVPGVLNIGWLASGEPFVHGESEPELADTLVDLFFVALVRQMRGTHGCEFCAEDPDVHVDRGGKLELLGSAELWIPGDEDVVYAAPTLIIHYIRAHRYLPPPEFISAVQNFRARAGSWAAYDIAEQRVAEAWRNPG